MGKCGNCCYGVMAGPNGMFCSAQNCFCEEVFDCEDYEPIVKPITNGDRIRSMSDEDLAAEMKEEGGCPHDCECPDVMDTDCYKCWLDWLRQEAKL